jgi:hypothetical protein
MSLCVFVICVNNKHAYYLRIGAETSAESVRVMCAWLSNVVNSWTFKFLFYILSEMRRPAYVSSPHPIKIYVFFRALHVIEFKGLLFLVYQNGGGGHVPDRILVTLFMFFFRVDVKHGQWLTQCFPAGGTYHRWYTKGSLQARKVILKLSLIHNWPAEMLHVTALLKLIWNIFKWKEKHFNVCSKSCSNFRL